MRIFLNGQLQQIGDQSSVQAMLAEMNLQDHRVAVEVNHEIVPRTLHAQVILAEGDRVEIIQAVGGG